MEELIIKQMIEDSPVPYFRVEVNRNNLGECIGVKLKKSNKAFKNFLNINKYTDSNNVVDFIMKDKLLKIWIDSLDKNSEVKKFSTQEYVESINSHCKMEFYNSGSNYIYGRIVKLDRTQIRLPKEFREAPFVSWIKDVEGRYIDVSYEFLKKCSVSYEDIIGKTDYDIMPKDRADTYYLEDIEVIRRNKASVHHYVHEYENTYANYQTVKWPYNDERSNYKIGTIGMVIRVIEDIDLISQIINNDEIDTDRVKNNIINDKDAIEKQDNTVSDTKIIKHNKVQWLSTSYEPMEDGNSRKIKKMCVIKDITEEKNDEIKIEKLKMDFFANLSHELRTPINLILSCIQLLELKNNEVKCKDLEYNNKYLGIIKQNGYRLLKLVNNLIDTTKIDSGNFSYSPRNMDIVNYIENITSSVCDFAKLNNIELVFDTDIEEKVIAFDLSDMERIILNLLSNAIKFRKDKGRIIVSIDTKEIGIVKISVKDDGIGIPKEKLGTIFNRFEQVKSKMKNEREGSGIGLSLVKTLVEMNNGKLNVISELDKGSEFIISLPDELTDNEDLIQEEKGSGLNNVYNMDVEFSDIYVY